MLIVMTGLPGSGKSTLAEALAIALSTAIVSVDPIEEAMWRAGIPRTASTGLAAYSVAQTVAEEQIRLGNRVIVDAVNAAPEARRVWEAVARRYSCELHVIEVICSDGEAHRWRIDARVAEADREERRRRERRDAGLLQAVPARAPLTWTEVRRQQSGYRPWEVNRLVIDSTTDLEENLKKMLRRVGD